MENFPEEKNPIGSVVTKILSDRQTDRQTDIILLCIIDILGYNQQIMKYFI